ncbi:MAG: tuaG [Anaerocolumna sp.]|nr:tuaG [Anaerocolumna sp.]
MVDNPMISVIIPVYNKSSFIGKAIDSVLLQKVSLELIIIDDCSTDLVDSVIKKYEKDKRVIFLRNNKNLGVAVSRNIGVNIARGEYIAYLDADDYWMPNKLEKQLIIMKKEKCAICFTERELIYEDDTTTGVVIKVKNRISYKMLKFHNCIACSSVMLPTFIAKEIPMCNDEYHEDYINWLQILKVYGIAYGIKEPLLKYRLSQNGKSRNRIKSAKMTYGVYRYMGMNKIQSLFYMLSHLSVSFIKQKIKIRL